MAEDSYSEAQETSDKESTVIDSLDSLEIPKLKQEEFKSQLLLELSHKLVLARDAKNEIKEEMIRYGNIRRARYSKETLKAITTEESGSTYYDPVGRTKCRAGIALIEDIFSPSDGKPWSMESTPVPDLPEDKRDKVKENILKQSEPLLKNANVMTDEQLAMVYEQIEEATNKAFEVALEMDKADAKERAKKMELVISDQLVEGHYKEASAAFISYLVTYHSAFIKGPLPRREQVIVHKKVGKGYEQVVGEKIKLVFEAPSPFDIYPSADQVGIDDGYFFERMYLDRKYLAKLKGVEGYSDDGINKVLEEYGSKGLTIRMDTDQERQEIENKDYKDVSNTSEKIEVFEYWGSVQGKVLIEWGLTKHKGEDIEDLDEYEITAWLTADMKHVLRCVLNPDTLGRRPYQMTSYMKVPNAFWGECVPSLMEESQRFINSISRAIENNVTICSGPQIFINDINRIPEGETLENMRPFKLWQFQAPHQSHQNQSSGDVIRFEQPQIHAQEITNIKNEARARIDEETGIPSYAHGGPQTSGAGGTARGLSMLMSSASKIIKQVIRNIDTVSENIIRRLYEYNMLNHEDDDIKGDVTIIPQGALSLIVKEQTQVRLNELLAITNNPTDNQIIDIVHRGRILREITKDLDLPANAIIPSEEELQKIQSGALQQEVVQQLSQQNPLIGMILSGEINADAIMAMVQSQKQTGAEGAGSSGGGGQQQPQSNGPAPATGSGMQENDSQPETDLGKLYQ